MLGEIIMQINADEMKRAAQIYLDTVFKVPVDVVDVKQVRSKAKRFEIKLRKAKAATLNSLMEKTEPMPRTVKPPPGYMAAIDKANTETVEEAKMVVGIDEGTGESKTVISKPLTIDEIRERHAGSSPNA